MAIKLSDLDPQFRTSLADLLKRCADLGMVMVPYDGIRTPWQQAKYWRQSRSIIEINKAIDMLKAAGAPFLARVLDEVGPQHGEEVTRVLPGNSWHQWGEAADLFWELDGKAEWSTTKKVNGKNGFRVMAEEAEKMGLNPGMLWSGFQDPPHVQMRSTANPRSSGLSWADIDQAMRTRFGTLPGEAAVVTASEAAGAAGGPAGALTLAYSSPEGWKIYETTDVAACVFKAGMTICCDGAPNAYHRNDAVALDYLANAGRKGSWWAVVTGGDGEPIEQSASDPAPGYYVSTTALNNPGFALSDPRRYVDATRIPYIVLPVGRYGQFAHPKGPRLGDVGIIYDTVTGGYVCAQFAELGPIGQVGEASVAAADAFGLNSNPKNGGTSKRRFVYIVFPGSGIGEGFDRARIDAIAKPLFHAWGGLARVVALSAL